MALQADILSAAALGVRNLMAVPGEDIRFGDHPQARTVNDLDLMGLLETVQKLQNGKDLSGIELRGSARFCVGSTLDTGAPGGLLNIELENLKRKVDFGVEYVLTNPIFDLRALSSLSNESMSSLSPSFPRCCCSSPPAWLATSTVTLRVFPFLLK